MVNGGVEDPVSRRWFELPFNIMLFPWNAIFVKNMLYPHVMPFFFYYSLNIIPNLRSELLYHYNV